MPIDSYSFQRFHDWDPLRPLIPIIITNPLSRKKIYYPSFALIDTGADSCSIPASIGEKLGHDLTAVKPVVFDGATGEGMAYPHTTTISIEIPRVNLSFSNMLIDYVEDLKFILLGVEGFLGKYILNIDYPNKLLSIKEPEVYTDGNHTP